MSLRELVGLKRKLTNAVEAAMTAITAQRARITELQRAIEGARMLPLPREEAKDRIRQRVVPAWGSAWLRDRAHGLLRGQTSHLYPNGSGLVSQLGPHQLPDRRHITEDVFGFICAAKPELAEDLLCALVDAVPYDEGLPSESRPAEIARLEAELAAVEADEEQAIDDARAAGVSIEHRVEVQQKRTSEARRQQFAEQARQRLADEQRAIESAYNPPAVSSYIRSNRPDHGTS